MGEEDSEAVEVAMAEDREDLEEEEAVSEEEGAAEGFNTTQVRRRQL